MGIARMAEVTGGQQLDNVLKALAKKIKGGHVRVGFLEGATYPNGTPVAMIAAIQEYGAPAKGIPPRPFFRNAIKENAANWPRLADAALAQSDNNTEAALRIIGARIAGQIQESIIKTNAPPLSPVTLLLRQRFSDHVEIKFDDVLKAWDDVRAGEQPTLSGTGAKPLVWTGQMLKSVDFEVVMDGNTASSGEVLTDNG